jgi:hypothetical protein
MGDVDMTDAPAAAGPSKKKAIASDSDGKKKFEIKKVRVSG